MLAMTNANQCGGVRDMLSCYDRVSRTAKLSCRTGRDETSSRRTSSCVEREKVVGYLLNLNHRYGASKARFFMGFGFQAEAWETLAAALREHGQQHEVTLTKETGFGPRFEVEGELAAPDGRRPQVRTVWQQDAGEVAPRLITAYPLESL